MSNKWETIIKIAVENGFNLFDSAKKGLCLCGIYISDDFGGLEFKTIDEIDTCDIENYYYYSYSTADLLTDKGFLDSLKKCAMYTDLEKYVEKGFESFKKELIDDLIDNKGTQAIKIILEFIGKGVY